MLSAICGSPHIQRKPGKAPIKIRQNVEVTEVVVAPETPRLLHTTDELQEERSQLSPAVLA